MLCAIVVSFSPAILFCIHTLLERLVLPSPRTLTEVIDILQPVHEDELVGLFDVRNEENLAAALPPGNRWKVRRNHARLFLEYLHRMSFNSLMLLLWSYAHEDLLYRIGGHEEEFGHIRDLIQAGAQVRVYTAIAGLWLTCRILLEGLARVRLRSLSSFRCCAGIDGLDSYGRLARAAAALSDLSDQQATPRLLHLLRGADLPR